MSIELMREKIKKKEYLLESRQTECKESIGIRIKLTLLGDHGKCSFLNTELIIGLGSLLLPYILGFIVITVFCLSMVDISLNTYFAILAESFSVTGLWTIGYFFLSILFFIYIVTLYLFKR